ncbi:N-6 DNA methylase [Aliarcobacter cryaerophilus]|uniref:type ISP restriction/modification enzyme n=1 Tax=Aliarcobacter cryaerophilus TaxID=28198 RepID=UPI003DA27D6F
MQILDPATGTGTFLAETIKFIKKDFWGGSWSSYVEEHLIPRLNGFELLMASYAMAHLKLDLLLLETGYKPSKEQKRFNIFLTNSLEEHHEQSGNLFASYLANESKEADRVKKDVPVMVVMGNPPYSGHSSNKNDFIDKLLEDYKKESDGSKLKEKNPKWLNDDYVKFIRYSESYIEKNQEGVLGFITNNSYINNPTFRGMRYHLLKTFDKIYIIDLHGDSKKKETAPDGSKDENVFDIMQGVAIIIAIKKKQKSKKLAELYLCDIYGKRDYKYEFLTENSLKSLPFEKIEFKEPNFYFGKRNDKLENKYLNNIDLNLLFPINGVGITTAHDKFVIDDSKSVLIERYEQFKASNPKVTNLYKKFEVKEKKGWNILDGWNNLQKIENIENLIQPLSYRLFDDKYIIYEDKLVWRTTRQIGKHFINNKDNIGLVVPRQSQNNWKHIFISKKIIEFNLTSTAGKFGSGGLFPLYLYPDENSLTNERTPNLNLEIVKEIEEKLGLKFVNEKIEDSTTFAPIDILDYIYAVLHSPSYREKYKEFLKIDFPRVPYPKPETFWQLVSLGGKLRSLHLLEDTSLDERIIDIKGEGELLIKNSLNKKDFSVEDEKVELRLNDEVSVVNIPLVAWEFYIGGYQPAQKWLKDRVGRVLNRADMKHYNRIINALCKTDLIMKKIDEVL